jgi:DNA invertase Pin-like site-specific DNA recombinase
MVDGDPEIEDPVGFSTDLYRRSVRPLRAPAGSRHQHAIRSREFQMCGVFAEFERGMICERVSAGPCAARTKGKRMDRRPIKPSVEERIRELRAEGMGILKIGRTVGVGTTVVQWVVQS